MLWSPYTNSRAAPATEPRATGDGRLLAANHKAFQLLDRESTGIQAECITWLKLVCHNKLSRSQVHTVVWRRRAHSLVVVRWSLWGNNGVQEAPVVPHHWVYGYDEAFHGRIYVSGMVTARENTLIADTMKHAAIASECRDE